MPSETPKTFFLTVLSSFVLWLILPYLGLTPNLLMLSSPWAVFILYLELQDKASLRFWLWLQVFCTSFLLFTPLLARLMI